MEMIAHVIPGRQQMLTSVFGQLTYAPVQLVGLNHIQDRFDLQSEAMQTSSVSLLLINLIYIYYIYFLLFYQALLSFYVFTKHYLHVQAVAQQRT